MWFSWDPLAGGEGPSGTMKDAKGQMAAVVPDTSVEACEYLVGCREDPASQQLQALAGAQGGMGTVFPISLASDKQCRLQKPSFSLEKGHSSVGTPSSPSGLYIHIPTTVPWCAESGIWTSTQSRQLFEDSKFWLKVMSYWHSRLH